MNLLKSTTDYVVLIDRIVIQYFFVSISVHFISIAITGNTKLR